MMSSRREPGGSRDTKLFSISRDIGISGRRVFGIAAERGSEKPRKSIVDKGLGRELFELFNGLNPL